ncbi:MAG: site-specific integrase [Candidatus Woesebacteria bacterium]|nr:site-specific integrase [Candidatus Woesebacteria bacterium]
MLNLNEVSKKVDDFIKYLSSHGVSSSSLKYYKSDITNFFNWANGKIIDSGLVKEYITSQLGSSSLKTINRRLSTLRSFSQSTGESFMAGIGNVSVNGIKKVVEPNKILDFDKFLINQKVSNNTRKNYLSDIRKFLAWKKDTEGGAKEYLNNLPMGSYDRNSASLKKYYEFQNKSFPVSTNQIPKNSPYRFIQELILNKLDSKPRLQDVFHKVFFNRPNWYKRYHSYPVATYIHIAILVLITSISGYAIYDQIFKNAGKLSAYPTALETPNRFLSFQGRLTDNLGNPKIVATNLVFKLYDADTAGTTLWDSTTCSITPDGDGIFSTLLGSTCGGAIAATVFSENADVWLGITIGADAEATPRIRIATVGYALNSETLQGFPPGTGASTIPYIDSTGKLQIAAASPTIESTSGTFAVTGQAMTISTANTTNGAIAINPDGTGTLNLTFEGAAAGGAVNGFINATNANITSGALYGGTVASAATGYNFIDFQSGVSPTSKFSIDYAGNTTMAGDLKLIGADILDTNGLEFLRFTSTASAVDELTIANAATGGVVTMAATGGDTDIALSIDAKGADALNLNGTATGDVNLAGGYGGTGCTITNSNGNLACNGTITGTIVASSLKWNALTTPDGALTLAMGTNATTFGWTPTAALDAWTMNLVNNGGSATTQNGLVVNNAVAGSFTDVATENLILVQQLDTTTAGTTVVTNGIKIDSAADSNMTNGLTITNSAGNITTGINIADAGGTLTTGILISGTVTTAMDAGNFPIINIGAANTDFNTSGGLTLAENLVVQGTTGLTFSTGVGGDITFALGEKIDNDTDGTIAITATNTFLSGDLKLGGNDILNSVGTGTIMLTDAPDASNSYQQLVNGSWLVNNTINNTLAALTVNSTKAGDIFTASASGTPLFVISNGGNVGIGTTAPAYTLDVTGNVKASEHLGLSGSNPNASWSILADETYTNTTAVGGIQTLARVYTTGASATHTGYGNLTYAVAYPASTFSNTGTVYGTLSYGRNDDVGTLASAYGVYGQARNVTTGIITSAVGVKGEVLNSSSGTITNAYGLVSDFTNAGTITNGYGVYIDNVLATNDYGVYQISTTDVNYFAGNVGIGTTAPGAKLHSIISTTSATSFLLSTSDYSSGTTGSGLTIYAAAASGNTIPLVQAFNAGGSNIANLILQPSGGNVGIGTTAPGYRLDVNSGSTSDVAMFTTTAAAGTGAHILLYQNSASPLASDEMGSIYFQGNNSAAAVKNYSRIAATIVDPASTSEDSKIEFFNLLAGTENTSAYIDAAGTVYADIGTGTFSPYYSYNFIPADKNKADFEYGDVVKLKPGTNKEIDFTNSNNDPLAYGVVHPPEGYGSIPEEFKSAVMGKDTEAANLDNYPIVPVAHLGTAITKIYLKPGEKINTGDAITSSEVTRYGQKSTQSGTIIGKSNQQFDPNSLNCTAISNIESVVWPDDPSKTNNTKPCFILPDGSHIGKVMVFVNVSWYDPEVYLTSTGDLNITKTPDSPYQLTNTATNSVIDKIGAFAEVVAANIKAGAIETTDFVSKNFVAFQATVDNLIVKNKIISPVVQTNLISPVSDTDLIIDLQPDNSQVASRLAIKGVDDLEVASIDASGNASFSGEIAANSLEVGSDATISGTLYADNIESSNLDQIDELLKSVDESQKILAESVNWNINTTTASASIDKLVSSEIITNNFFVTGSAAITSLFVSDNLTTKSINSLDSALSIQSLALAPVEIMAGKIKIETNGDITFSENVEIAGNLKLKGNIVVIADAPLTATDSAQITPGEINTNATAGKAILTANTNEVKIINPKINNDTLIYVTPLSSTQNKVLYVKSKDIGYFTVGFSDTLDTDVEFNWWIIELESIDN